MVKPINIFISYAHEDAAYLEELQNALAYYERKSLIKIWTDKNIVAGEKWDEWIRTKLKNAEIALFLVSSDFLASDYIHHTEIKTALENNRLIIIPIIVRPINMGQLELNAYQVLPSEAKPVEKWVPKDEAWVDVTLALDKVIEKLNGAAVNENAAHNGRSKPVYGATLKTMNYSDKLVRGMLLLLLVFSIGMFGYGVVAERHFFTSAAAVGIGLSLAGYILTKKLMANN